MNNKKFEEQIKKRFLYCLNTESEGKQTSLKFKNAMYIPPLLQVHNNPFALITGELDAIEPWTWTEFYVIVQHNVLESFLISIISSICLLKRNIDWKTRWCSCYKSGTPSNDFFDVNFHYYHLWQKVLQKKLLRHEKISWYEIIETFLQMFFIMLCTIEIYYRNCVVRSIKINKNLLRTKQLDPLILSISLGSVKLTQQMNFCITFFSLFSLFFLFVLLTHPLLV